VCIGPIVKLCGVVRGKGGWEGGWVDGERGKSGGGGGGKGEGGKVN